MRTEAEIRESIAFQSKILAKLKMQMNLSNSSYYRGRVLIAAQWADAGLREDMIASLKDIPEQYFETSFRRQAADDEEFRKSAESVAYMIVNFTQDNKQEN